MKITYEQTKDDIFVDKNTGEILKESHISEYHSITNKKITNEPDYIKIYTYVNTLFAFKGIKQSLTPFVIEISNLMSYAENGQIVSLNKVTKSTIAKNLGVSPKRLDQVIAELRDCDILRKIQNGVYAVNPYICTKGKWADIKKLQAQFDFVNGEMLTIDHHKDTITGEDVKRVITNKQMPGQLNMFDLGLIEDDEKND